MLWSSYCLHFITFIPVLVLGAPKTLAVTGWFTFPDSRSGWFFFPDSWFRESSAGLLIPAIPPTSEKENENISTYTHNPVLSNLVLSKRLAVHQDTTMWINLQSSVHHPDVHKTSVTNWNRDRKSTCWLTSKPELADVPQTHQTPLTDFIYCLWLHLWHKLQLLGTNYSSVYKVTKSWIIRDLLVGENRSPCRAQQDQTSATH